MKKLNTKFIICIAILLSTIGSAQNNRVNNKKSNIYRASYQRIATGSDAIHTLEIREGTLWAWGFNSSGELGDGTTTTRNRPVRVGTDNDWVSIACGSGNSFGIKSNGTLWAWGNNSWGQLGDGTTVNKISPIQIGTDNNWISIVSGSLHSIGLKSDGTLWAWGDNYTYQLGDGTTTTRISPVQIGVDNKWQSLSLGFTHGIGLKSDGTIWGWGSNSYGEVGDGSLVAQPLPIQIGTENNWVSIEASNVGSSHALKVDGTLWGWGFNGYFLINDNTTISYSTPTQSGNDNNWVNITAGAGHIFGIKSNGTLWGWGLNGGGQLGTGTVDNKTAPEKLNGYIDAWINISAGLNHNLGIKSNGTLWSWGSNGFGELGDSTLVIKSSPVRTGIDNDWVSIAGGSNFSLGIKSNGTLWAWGKNDSGQLGDGTLISKNYPIQIGTDNNWVSISCGHFHSFGMKSDGTVWSWGVNSSGQLGNGTIVDSSTPVQIGISSIPWVSIAAIGTHSLGLKSDGTLWSWGANSFGQVGDGTTVNKTSPVQIGTDNKWISISGGFAHSLALKSDGTIWSWGFNTHGELGDGTIVNKTSPVQIGIDNKWIKISVGSGNYHNSGLKSNGTMFSWGYNTRAQLGDGTLADRYNPTQIGSETNWVDVKSGYLHTVGMKANRSMYCAVGSGDFGQIGNNALNSIENFFICNTNPCVQPPAPMASNDSICINNSANLSANGIGVVSWYDELIDGTLIFDGINFTTPNLTTSTTYFLQDSTCAISVRTPVTVVVNNPIVTAGATETTLCYGTSTILTGDGALTYQWTEDVIDGTSFIPATTLTYTVVGTDHIGCSNSATITIIVNTVDTTVSVFSGSLEAMQSGATYQWGDCDSQMILPGETNQSYTPEASGNYIVLITYNGCTDTSSCNSFTYVGIDELAKTNLLKIYPNPNNGIFIISLNETSEKSEKNNTFYIINELGQTIQKLQMNDTNQSTFEVKGLNDGVYFLHGIIKDQIINQRIIVTK